MILVVQIAFGIVLVVPILIALSRPGYWSFVGGHLNWIWKIGLVCLAVASSVKAAKQTKHDFLFATIGELSDPKSFYNYKTKWIKNIIVGTTKYEDDSAYFAVGYDQIIDTTNPLAKSINIMLRESALGKDLSIKDDADSLFKMNKENATEEFNPPYYSYSEDSLFYINNKYVVIKHFFEQYTGGAHEGYGTGASVFRGNNLKESVKINDLFSTSEIKVLRQIVRDSLENRRLDYFYEVHKIELPKTFLFNAKFISFIYNPGSIGPNAIGEVRVNIPWYALKQNDL